MPGAHPLDGTSKLPSPSVRSPTDLECAAVQRGRPSGTPGHPDLQVDQTEIKSGMEVALGNKLLTVLTLINNMQFYKCFHSFGAKGLLYYTTILYYYTMI